MMSGFLYEMGLSVPLVTATLGALFIVGAFYYKRLIRSII